MDWANKYLYHENLGFLGFVIKQTKMDGYDICQVYYDDSKNHGIIINDVVVIPHNSRDYFTGGRPNKNDQKIWSD